MMQHGELCEAQRSDVQNLRSMLDTTMGDVAEPLNVAEGLLLTGSVALGDTRVDPMGVYIDSLIGESVADSVDLCKTFGEDVAPGLPFHYARITGDVSLVVSTITVSELFDAKSQPESRKYAMKESEILWDLEGKLLEWKRTALQISDHEIKDRALCQFFLFGYQRFVHPVG